MVDYCPLRLPLYMQHAGANMGREAMGGGYNNSFQGV